ncbi:unnamed protein product [Protopolystoma xenopodis]|uniref:Uncharacterized protein n=1 Tax=Protopolystoma xenopodis TaxID=117903 RepID=A0A448WFE8_9PLAT|nr:unnamed protein product [Protopolystoma xenopodis]
MNQIQQHSMGSDPNSLLPRFRVPILSSSDVLTIDAFTWDQLLTPDQLLLLVQVRLGYFSSYLCYIFSLTCIFGRVLPSLLDVVNA